MTDVDLRSDGRPPVVDLKSAADGDGAVAQEDIVGIAATAYDHWDSRLGDPQLHTHVVISNKVKTVQDGRWRSLDGRPMHAAVVAISEHYNAVLADRITRTFGIEWDQRDRGKDRNSAWELAPVSEVLIREFSSRSRAIDKEKDRLIEEYVELVLGSHSFGPLSAELRRPRPTITTSPCSCRMSSADARLTMPRTLVPCSSVASTRQPSASRASDGSRQRCWQD